MRKFKAGNSTKSFYNIFEIIILKQNNIVNIMWQYFDKSSLNIVEISYKAKQIIDVIVNVADPSLLKSFFF